MSNGSASLLIELKGINEDRRILSGIASSATLDRMGDIVEPLGCKFAPVIPLLLNHDRSLVVGTATLGKPTAKGVPFVAHIPRILDPGTLRDEVDRAWHAVKYKLVRHVSIGFTYFKDKAERLAGGGLRFLEVEILELSLVPIPAQVDAEILAIKAAEKTASIIGAVSSPVAAFKAIRLDALECYWYKGKSCDEPSLCKWPNCQRHKQKCVEETADKERELAKRNAEATQEVVTQRAVAPLYQKLQTLEAKVKVAAAPPPKPIVEPKLLRPISEYLSAEMGKEIEAEIRQQTEQAQARLSAGLTKMLMDGDREIFATSAYVTGIAKTTAELLALQAFHGSINVCEKLINVCEKLIRDEIAKLRTEFERKS